MMSPCMFRNCFPERVPLSIMSVWKLESLLSHILSLLSSYCTHFFLSDLLTLEAPLSACGLFTRNTDSPSEVWLASTSWERNMNEFTPALQPSTSTLYSQILSPLLVLPLHAPQLRRVTLFHSCVRLSLRVYLCEANSGQRLIFVAGSVCIPTACRRLRGQLFPAPFPLPRASPENLCNQPLLSHFWIFLDKKQCFVSSTY